MKVVEVSEDPFQCPLWPECKQRFKNAHNIKRHLDTVHSECNKKYMCIICKKLYQTKGNFDQHFDKTHVFEWLLYASPELVEVKGTLCSTQTTIMYFIR